MNVHTKNAKNGITKLKSGNERKRWIVTGITIVGEEGKKGARGYM